MLQVLIYPGAMLQLLYIHRIGPYAMKIRQLHGQIRAIYVHYLP